MKWATCHDGQALYVAVSCPATGDPANGSPLSSVLVKIEPRRLWPCKHFLYRPGSRARAELPEQVAPQSVEGRTVRDEGARRTVVRIPLERIGPEALRLRPLRVDVQVERAGAGACSWRPSNPTTPRLHLGTDNPAELGWLVFSTPRA